MGSRRTAPRARGDANRRCGDRRHPPSAHRGEPAPLLLGLRSRLESRREVAAIAPGPLQATGARRRRNPTARTTPKRPIEDGFGTQSVLSSSGGTIFTDTNVIADRAVDMVVDVGVDPVAGRGPASIQAIGHELFRHPLHARAPVEDGRVQDSVGGLQACEPPRIRNRGPPVPSGIAAARSDRRLRRRRAGPAAGRCSNAAH